jgi:hypothetical protein
MVTDTPNGLPSSTYRIHFGPAHFAALWSLTCTSTCVAQHNEERKKEIEERFAMKMQNIIRMQAMIVGFGAALVLASAAPAQEIVNTEFSDGPNVAAFQQPAATQAVATTTPAAATSSSAVTPGAVATPVATEATLDSFEGSARRWLVASVFFGIAMLTVYALAEIRRSTRKLTQRPSSHLHRGAAVS